MHIPTIKPREHLPIATFVVIALALLAVGRVWQGWQRGVIEIDRAEPLPYAFRVDLNKAEWPELAQLPEIGPKLAQAIVAHREQHGPFRRRSQLDDVQGIGERTMVRIESYLLPLPDDAMVAGP